MLISNEQVRLVPLNPMKAALIEQTRRKIIHVDMDAFFASVEQRDYPELRGKPVVVGGDGKRSVVAAASYEARRFGIHSAMPMALAKQKCQDLRIVPHRFQVYQEVSSQIRAIFEDYTDLVEPLSLDEAYLDVTQNKKQMRSATLIAKEIKVRVKERTSLTCTAGVSINKFLAKIASDMNKPDGLTVIKPDQVADFIKTLPIEKFYGVGRVTADKMQRLKIYNGGDLQRLTELELVQKFGKAGRYYYQVCRGIDERPVLPTRIRKSISIERTFEENMTEQAEVMSTLERLCRQLVDSLLRKQIQGKTVNVKWRYGDFTTPTRAKSFKQYTSDLDLILATAKDLLLEHWDQTEGIRLLGVGLSNLDTEIQEDQQQLSLKL